MNTKIKILVGILVFLLVFLGTWKYAHAQIQTRRELQAQEAERIALERLKLSIEAMSVPELIDYIAPQYGASPELLKKIVWCESNFKTDVWHDNKHGWGTTGFHRTTFEDWQKRFGREDLIYESNFDQIVLMAIAFEKGESYRRAWTSYRAYSNGGTYTFYSRLMGRWYTVTCK